MRASHLKEEEMQVDPQPLQHNREFSLAGSASKRPSISDEADELVRRIKEFRDRVRRTVVLEELSPAVTAIVIESAFSQFGTVVKVDVLRRPDDPKQGLGRALVEMQTAENANNVVKQVRDFLFEIGGLPRPVSCRNATEDLFKDSPIPSKRPKLQFRFVEKGHPSAEKAIGWRNLYCKHRQQGEFLEKFHRDEEDKLASEQEKQMGSYYKILQGMLNVNDDLLKDAYGMNYNR